MTHYRAFFASDKYLTSADLYDEATDSFRDLVVAIERVEKLTMVGEKGKTDVRPGLHFVGSKSKKPLGLNAGNSDQVVAIAGSTDMKKWPGVAVMLRVEMVVIRGKGPHPRPAIRIHPAPPQSGKTTPPNAEEQAEIARREREAAR